jgi:hypothetical protein
MNYIQRHINTIGILLVLAFAAAAAGLYWNVPGRTRQTTQADAAQASYTCPMHPDVTSDKPGNCPICGMKLVAADSALPAEAGCCRASITPDTHAGRSDAKQTNSSCGMMNPAP